MKTVRGIAAAVLLFACGSAAEAAFWGSAGGGYSSDDNFYKDVFTHSAAGYYYTLNVNARNKLSSGLQYDASYLLLGRKNADITWEDSLMNNVRVNLLARPSDVFNLRLLTSFENKTFPDEFSKKYSYDQYRAGIEMPVYVFDYTVPKAGFTYEKISYDGFDYDSAAAGPLVGVQQELSPWTMISLSVQSFAREYPGQYLYADITATTAANRQDTETCAGVTLSSVINRDWNFSAGLRHEDIRSNANLPVPDPDVAVSSRTLAADYYSYASPSLFVETVFYPARKVSCQVGGTYQEKAYAARQATDSPGRLLAERRKDRRFVISAGATYRLSGPVALKLDYSYENSSSNDYIYTYTNGVFSTGVTVYF
ncbi:MAG: hypothetical protein ACYC5N_07785 [Endomicrobiales bacterium]